MPIRAPRNAVALGCARESIVIAETPVALERPRHADTPAAIHRPVDASDGSDGMEMDWNGLSNCGINKIHWWSR
jgi:hypothetical protein